VTREEKTANYAHHNLCTAFGDEPHTGPHPPCICHRLRAAEIEVLERAKAITRCLAFFEISPLYEKVLGWEIQRHKVARKRKRTARAGR
jgi:hypothetical protein